MNKYAIIVAGGSGQRMESELPKQFMELGGKPILMHTLEAFHKAGDIHIILVLPGNQFGTWQELLQKHNFDIPHQLVSGGDTRFHSVKNGLSVIESYDGYVAVHDGVRPFIDESIIHKSFETALLKGNAVTSIPLKDSIRNIGKQGSRAVNRNEFVLIQTPQTFKLDILKDCYAQDYNPDFTDDASVVESKGEEISLIAGSESNIKITTPHDIVVAEAILKVKK